MTYIEIEIEIVYGTYQKYIILYLLLRILILIILILKIVILIIQIDNLATAQIPFRHKWRYIKKTVSDIKYD